MCEDKPPCKQIETIHKYKTDFNADSVEWCPHEPFQDFFVCANYQLKDSEKRERHGCILLFSATLDTLQLLQTIQTAAILDQKWCHNQIDNYSILAVANALKTVEIYRLDPELKHLEFVTSCKIDEENEETLILSLDWSTGKFESVGPELVCSDSKGNIHILRFAQNKLVKELSWSAHSFEAWIAAFNYWDPNVVFTGGDDCYFLKFDKRVGIEPVAKNRSHEAGVTSIHSNSKKEFVLVTGSYDSHVRLWDTRYLKNCTKHVKMPETVWRLKWDPFNKEFILAACMLGGVHIIGSNLEIVDSYYEHKNISYGVDWCLKYASDPLLASCSFYDNLLCVSQIKLKLG